MDAQATGGVLRYFVELKDPRRHNVIHRFTDILTIAILAVLCGAEDWEGVAIYGRGNIGWLKSYLHLPKGIPSPSTFRRVFARIHPQAFERCFMNWTQALAEKTCGRFIAIDGKTLRRSFEHAWDKQAIHLISAWSSSNHLVLGQLATEQKSNEITAIPKLLELLDLQGATVTIDAAGCQKEIARQIVQGGGDYILAVKENQPTLYKQVKALLDEGILERFAAMEHDHFQQTEAGHGRMEKRRVWCTPEVQWIGEREQWEGLRSLVVVESRRTVNGQSSMQRRYYISSRDGSDARKLGEAIRGHWGIENQLHWSLDVSFHEDQRRLRKDHGAENFSRLCRLALNLLKSEPTLGVGIKNKRLACAWDHEYLLRVLQQ